MRMHSAGGLHATPRAVFAAGLLCRRYWPYCASAREPVYVDPRAGRVALIAGLHIPRCLGAGEQRRDMRVGPGVNPPRNLLNTSSPRVCSMSPSGALDRRASCFEALSANSTSPTAGKSRLPWGRSTTWISSSAFRRKPAMKMM